MNLRDLLASVRFVLADRVRAALTLLGIIIGTSSIVLLAGLLRGGKEALTRASQRAAGDDLIVVRAQEVPVRERQKTRRELSREDARVLAASKGFEGTEIASETFLRSEARFLGKRKRVSVMSATPEAVALYRLTLARGRFFDADDLAARRRVCVIGHEVVRDLFPDRDPARDSFDDVEIEVEGQRWAVVGVLSDRPILGSTDSTNIWNRKVVVPETTYDALFSPEHEASRLYIRPRRDQAISTPTDALRSLVAATLKRTHLGVTNFKIEDDKSKGQEWLILGVIQMLLFGTGFIALAVGGINIMNIMLVTVTERTREIGIRRAVGASPRAILGQFLFESALLSLTGGIFGVLFGIGLSWGAASLLNRFIGSWPLYIEPWAIALGLSMSAVTGVVFGFYPARRASKLDPIEALRAT